ncbi:MAG: hypothetical protein E7219_01030 [Clostridiales bacterium]|jgi:hypothetical protein|nr:hypothetical protein [Clostridiales bacterium]
MKKKLLTLLIAICMIMSMGILAACGGSSGGESSDSGSGTETAEPAADPEEKFAGDWKLAAAESEGVYMAGNFTELLELSDEGNGNVTLTINANKTGVINLGDESANFTWELKSDDVITITPETETDKVGETADISYKEDALWLTIVQEEKEASLIYTKDGIFADAKDFNMADAKDITSKDELVGKWTLTGMKLMGIAMYGDAEALKNATSSGEEVSINFKEDGTAEMNGNAGTWEVTSDGATMTSTDVTGTHTYPVKKLGDDIVLDGSELLNGNEYLMVLSKTN